ncbi:MAG: sorbosone dehydrogenase family protein [Acidobacteria bacterium]|nr:sorbosone dehydrogenase family protein [Acidobacteriota bacterium]
MRIAKALWKGFVAVAASAILSSTLLAQSQQRSAAEYGPGTEVTLAAPLETPSARNRSQVVGWPAGRKPTAPPGFQVDVYADKLEAPRWTYVLPNGDVLVALSLDGRIVLLRDSNKDGRLETRTDFLAGQSRPFGTLLLGGYLYVGNTNAVVRFRYQTGQTELSGTGEKILDLPGGGHWTRNLTANANGSKIYVSVGSRSNVDEDGSDAKDPRRAAILEINPDGSGMRVFASGLRNPVGMAWEPVTTMLWTAVNERDGLGDRLVPDYITSVRDGAFYGWPYSYYGKNEDPRKKGQRPDLVAKAIVPDYAVGAHTASLGLAFYTGSQYPEKYRGGAFIGQHGSWNRSQFAGYKVAFLPFRDGKPAGTLEDFLTGFIASASEVYGRPVGVSMMPDGSLLVADDEGGKLWRVHYVGR